MASSLVRRIPACLPHASGVDDARVKHHTVVAGNGDASLFLALAGSGSGPDSAAGARRDSVGHAEIAGSGVRPRVAIGPGRHRNTTRRSTAGRGHNASRSAPGADIGHTGTIGHRPSHAPRRGGLDDPAAHGDTGHGAVRECGSRRSPGRDRQVKSVRGCVGLLAEPRSNLILSPPSLAVRALRTSWPLESVPE